MANQITEAAGVDHASLFDLGLFEVKRTHIELFGELEELGRALATIGRRLSRMAAFTASPQRRA